MNEKCLYFNLKQRNQYNLNPIFDPVGLFPTHFTVYIKRPTQFDCHLDRQNCLLACGWKNVIILTAINFQLNCSIYAILQNVTHMKPVRNFSNLNLFFLITVYVLKFFWFSIGLDYMQEFLSNSILDLSPIECTWRSKYILLVLNVSEFL